MIKLNELLKNLSTVRTEFKGQKNSVLSNFVKPPFFESINLSNFNQSVALVGSRGSGKTIYLKYFSHWTQFDKNNNPTKDSLSSLILYWKPDTIICRSLERGHVDADKAQLFFEQYTCIEITKEIVHLLSNVKYHFPKELGDSELQDIYKSILRHFHVRCEEKILSDIFVVDELNFLLSDSNTKLVNNEDFIILSPSIIIIDLLTRLQRLAIFSNSSFKIFIDEFENLTLNQQSFINGLRKHSDNLVSWNVAYKAYAETSNLVSIGKENDERLQEPNDFRTLNLDSVIRERKSEVKGFFAKILMVTIDKESYHEASFTECENEAKKIFVNVQLKNLIEDYFNKNVKGFKQVLDSLEEVQVKMHDKALFNIVEKDPVLAVALTVIKDHKNFSPIILSNYLESRGYESDKSLEEKINHFTKAAVYKLNISSSFMKIPIYSGFDTLIIISSFNIRYFLELSYQAIISHLKSKNEDDEINVNDLYAIDRWTVHKSFVTTSSRLLQEIVSFAPMGQRLSRFVNRLGEVFRIKHQMSPITEPEINHFTISNDNPNTDLKSLINQALCWNVLIAHQITKTKDVLEKNRFDYQLNPIYCPAFGITTNKKHKVTFSTDDLNILVNGEESDWVIFRDTFLKQDYHSNTQGSLPL